MSDKGSMSDWFGKRRESVISRGIRDHAEKVCDTISEINRAFGAMANEDHVKAIDAIRRLTYSEKEADNVEERMSEELAKGDLAPKEREDLMHLVRRMEDVADWGNEASRDLQLTIEANVSVPVNLWRKFFELTTELEKSSKAMRQSVDAFGVSSETVMSQEKAVGVLEHIIDDMYFSIKKEILMTELDPKGLYILMDMLRCLEESSDSSKDAVDMLHILVISHQYHSH